MANPELIAYIKVQLNAGVKQNDVKAALLSAGWEENDINEGLAQIIDKPIKTPKSKSLSWQVATIIITSSIVGGILVTVLNFAVLLVISNTAVSIVLRLSTQIMATLIGVLFGVAFVSGRSEVTDERARKIVLWVAIVEFVLLLLSFWGSSNKVTLTYLPQFFTPVVMVLCTWFFLTHRVQIQRTLSPRTVRLTEIIGMIVLPIVFMVIAFIIVKNTTLMNIFFNALPQEIQDRYGAEIAKVQNDMVANSDDMLKIVVDYTARPKLSMYFLVNNRYPASLSPQDFNLGAMGQKLGDIAGADIEKEYERDRDQLRYAVSSDGKSFRLCADLSTGEYCQEGSSGN